jgi:WD40 repeat protein
MMLAGESYNYVYVWDVEQGSKLTRIPLQEVGAVAFTADGSRLVTGAEDGTLRMWDPLTGRELDSQTGNLGEVTDVAVSPDGDTLATSSTDGTVRLWDGRSLAPLITLAADAHGKVAFSPDGGRLAYIADDGAVRVLALDIEDLMQLARSRLTRSLTPSECRDYLHIEGCASTTN